MILIYLSQIGSAQFFLPILKNKNLFKKNKIIILTNKLTNIYLSKHNIVNKKINYKQIDIFNFLKKNNPKKIILSATINDTIEKKIIVSSKLLNIPTYSFIDMWINYKERFLSNNKLILPDYILTIDSFAKKEMINDKIPKNKIKIVGHPYFEYLANLNIPIGKMNVFFSQPLGLKINPEIKYSKNFFYSFYKKNFNLFEKNSIYMSLHPNEKLSNIDDRKKYNIKKSKDFYDILNTKNAFGIYSTQLISSYLLKRNVYVIGNSKQKFDPFPLSRWGLINKIYSTNDLKLALDRKYKFNNKFINSFKYSEKKLLNILLN